MNAGLTSLCSYLFNVCYWQQYIKGSLTHIFNFQTLHSTKYETSVRSGRCFHGSSRVSIFAARFILKATHSMCGLRHGGKYIELGLWWCGPYRWQMWHRCFAVIVNMNTDGDSVHLIHLSQQQLTIKNLKMHTNSSSARNKLKLNVFITCAKTALTVSFAKRTN